MTKKSLGRGLDALIPSDGSLNNDADSGENCIHQLPLEKIQPNRWQPRQDFSDAGIEELAQSLASAGVLQPIVVQKAGEGYELIAGERRLRAAKKVGWQTIPALVKEVNDKQRLQLSLIENIQRENLNPIEEALAYQNLIQLGNYTQEELSGVVGKERSTISNSLRLLKLPEEIQRSLRGGLISSGHARAILALESLEEQSELCQLIVDRGWSVRQAEEYVQHPSRPKKNPANKPGLDALLQSLQERLTQCLTTRVKIAPKSNGKGGKLVIEYYSNEDLERILQSMHVDYT